MRPDDPAPITPEIQKELEKLARLEAGHRPEYWFELAVRAWTRRDWRGLEEALRELAERGITVIFERRQGWR